MPAVSTPVESITWGTTVADPNIEVYFVPDGDMLGGFTSEGASAYEIAQFEAVYDIISSIANVTFTVVDDPDAYFQIAIDDDEIAGSLDGKMGPPGEDNEGEGIFDGKDIVRGPEGPLDPGGYDFMVVMHETMHGLGLAHPHDDGGGSSIMNGVDDAFDDYGDFGLNQGVYTVMTYNNGYFLGTPGSMPDEDGQLYGYEAGPMALDIAVLQAAYGANMTTATGDDFYDLPDENESGTKWVSIWDAGGEDTLRYEGDKDTTIDLRAATLEYAVGGGGFISSADGIAGGFTIANGVVIENAVSGSGDDALTGNLAANTLSAGAGEDMLMGGAGDDTLTGGADADSFKSGAGDGADRIEDFDPNEDVLMFEGIDTGSGEGAPASIEEFLEANGTVSGSDFLIDLDGSHSVLLVGVIDAGDPDASIAAVAGAIQGLTFDGTPGENFPSEGDDVLTGGPEDDVIDALGGDDKVSGEGGEDTLQGNTGDDEVLGGAGDDNLFGGEGNDTVLGGADDDRVSGDEGDDTVEGGDGNDRVFGDRGDDLVSGGDGRDRVSGDRGDDTVDGGDGSDWADGNKGDDSVSGGAGDDRVNGHQGDDFVDGGDGIDWVDGGIGDDTVLGGAGDDRVNGRKGDDFVDGGDGDDQVDGHQGNDTLEGGDGNDTLNGGNGEDRLSGDAGDDTLTGGRQADTFVSDSEGGNDVITDFSYGEDLIELSDVAFGDDDDQVTRAEFLSENASIDGEDLFLDLGEGSSIRILGVVDEDEIGDAVEDYEDLFADF